MQIYEGRTDNIIFTEDDKEYELPFSIALKDFRIEYYKPGNLYIQTRKGDFWKFPAQVGKIIPPDPDFGTIEIIKIFSNFRMIMEDGNRGGMEDPGPGSNPALQVKITPPTGQPLTRYVFNSSSPRMYSDDFVMFYESDVKEYISDLQVIKDNKVVKEKDIEVNHPLYFGGYHFYQHSYDSENGRFTVLKVTSNSGLNFVYLGYFMLCVGVCWHFWINKLRTRGV